MPSGSAPARCVAILALVAACLGWAAAAETKPGLAPVGPLSPRDELATFRIARGFKVELVASEPDVVDPVALAFDENGRLFVAEMRGYPNAGVATGSIHSGKIKLLEDRDGDGVFEHSRVYAEGLRFPNSVMPWKGGLLASVAPDLLYFEDRDGDGTADRHRTLYTGFDLSNIQQLVNGLQWGLDNWVHGAVGSKGGTITCPEKPGTPAVELRSRHIRFHPDKPGTLEPTSGGGQFGLSPDDWQQWFTATNSQHLRHIVLPDHYLRRNPFLPVAAVTLDIPDHGASCKVFRISPFEAWRVERTRRRAEGSDARRFAATELVPGGYITSGSGPAVYTADLFPEAYRGNTFVCDPANNLVHRDVLEPNGATFIARRADADCEFLASTDTWFRPVFLTVGPDGALYLADFYREAIETPLSLPDDIKKKLNLETRGKGRIWRIVPEGTRRVRRPALRQAPTADLVAHLADGNLWWRLTAQRLLVERQDRAAIAPLERLAAECPSPQGRAHALWTLQGLQALRPSLLQRAVEDPSAGVREQALRLADLHVAAAPELRAALLKLADDPSPRVRFQLAFTLGEVPGTEAVPALARIARHPATDSWTQTAVLSSVRDTAPVLLGELARDAAFRAQLTPAQLSLVRRLAAIAGARAEDAQVAQVLGLLAAGQDNWNVTLLEGLGQGMQNSRRPLSQLWEQPPALAAGAVAQAQGLFRDAAGTAHNARASSAARLAAVRLLGYAPFATAGPAFQQLLTPQTEPELQLAAVRSLAQHVHPDVAGALLGGWNSYSPAVRREVLEALFARADRLGQLLTALEKGQVPANQLEPTRLDQLRNHPRADLRRRAVKALAGQATPDRVKILEAYHPALELVSDAERGRAVFKRVCATCHRLNNEGTEVGPDLVSALRNKTPAVLLTDILDPSREVDPRYLNYVVATRDGRVLSGMIAAETGASITLRRAEKAEDTVLRSQVEEIQATAKSVMPEGLEMQVSKQDLADLIAYLQSVAAPK